MESSRKTIQVVAAVIEHQGRILATQRGYGDYAGWWEFPGGKVEPGESHQGAIIREIKEEMDADIEVGSYVMTVEFDYPKFHLVMHCYLAHLVSEFTLLEHHAAVWTDLAGVDSLKWLEADLKVIDKLKRQGVLR